MGGLHSGETGPSEMLMELVYRLATETSPLIKQIRDNVIVSITPVADPDGRDRNVDWFYRGLDEQQTRRRPRRGATGAGGGRGAAPAARRRTRRRRRCRTGASTSIHDNNRDINLSQVSMRAIVDWYFTAHPPIMHDLHEAQPLLYTYSGGPPQNPESRSDSLRRAAVLLELRAGADDEVGHAGRLHARVHGRLVARLPRLGRLQPQRHDADVRDAVGPRERPRRPAAAAPRRGAAAGGGAGAAAARGSADAAGARGGDAGAGGRADAARRADAAAPVAAGAGERPRRAGRRRRRRTWRPAAARRRGGRRPDAAAGSRASGIAACRFRRARRTTSRAATTRTTWRPACCRALQLTSMFPNLVVENFYRKTQNSIEAGKTDAPYGYVIPVQRDMTRVAELVNILRVQRIEVGQATAEIKVGDGTFPAGSYVIKRDQPYGRLAKNLLEKQSYPDPEPHAPTTTAAGRWGWRC